MVARLSIGFLLLCTVVHGVTGTGRMMDPPQRSSLWRDPIQKFNPVVVKNFEDHRLNCGGLWRQTQNDGRCGVCGDPWDMPMPRPNEAGGKYGLGIIGRTYFPSDRFIPVRIQILSTIDGYFEFKICPNNDVNSIVTQDCLDKNPLMIYSEDRWTSYGTEYNPDLVPNKPGNISLALEIPNGLTCSQCVLQWRWHGGNNWGNCPNGTSATGCGPQEEYYNCADIAILGTGDSVSGKMQRVPPVIRNIRRNTLQSNAAAMIKERLRKRNSPASSNAVASGQVALSRARKNGMNALNRQPTKSSTLANVVAQASNTTGLVSSTMHSTENRRLFKDPIWATMFGRSSRRDSTTPNSKNMAPVFSKNIRPAMSDGRTNMNTIDTPQLLNMVYGQLFNNTNLSINNTMSMNDSGLDAHLLEWMMNPRSKAGEYLKLSLLIPLLRNDLAISHMAMNQLATSKMATGLPEIKSIMALLQVVQDYTNNVRNESLMQNQSEQLSSLGGLSIPAESKMFGTGVGLNVPIPSTKLSAVFGGDGAQRMVGLNPGQTTGPEKMFGSTIFEGNSETYPKFGRLPSVLQGNRQMVSGLSTDPELFILASLLGRGSGGSRSGGGGEAQEGGRTSTFNPLLLLNPELQLVSSLLGRGGSHGGGEVSEGGQTPAGNTHTSMNIMNALSSLFGRNSQGGGERAEGGRISTAMDPLLPALSSLLGGASSAGGEGAGGIGLLSSFFGGSSQGTGGEGSEGSTRSSGIDPQLLALLSRFGKSPQSGDFGQPATGSPQIPFNPTLMMMSSLFRRSGSRGAGEASEGGEARSGGMAGMSQLPLLAYILRGNSAGMTASAPPQMTDGITSPGSQPFDSTSFVGGSAPGNTPYLLNAMLGRQMTMGSLVPMNVLALRAKETSIPQTPLGAMSLGGPFLSQETIRPLGMRPGQSASPMASLLDLYRLTGGSTGRRSTRLID